MKNIKLNNYEILNTRGIIKIYMVSLFGQPQALWVLCEMSSLPKRQLPHPNNFLTQVAWSMCPA